MKIMIAPRSLDSNKGDQALMLRAVEFVRSADDGCEVGIMTEDPDGDGKAQVRHTRSERVNIFSPILPHPRRVANKRIRKVIDSGSVLWKMRCRAILDFFQSILILFCSGHPRLARTLLGKERFRTYVYLRSCRALIVRGGGFIYAHGGVYWAYFLWFSLFIITLAHRCGIPVIVLPNSFGPFDTRWSRWWAGRVLRRCRILTAREYISRNVLELYLRAHPLLFPDMAFGLEPSAASWARKELEGRGVPLGRKLCVGVTMRPWRFLNVKNCRARYESYLRSFASFLEYAVAGGFAPVLFAHSVGPHAHEDDRIALNAVLDLSSVADEVIMIDDDYDCRQAQALYGCMDYMVCTRFHSAIFSINQKVPCLAVSYQGYKVKGIMEEIGLGNFILSIDSISAVKLISAFESLRVEKKEVRKKMEDYGKACRDRLDELRRLMVGQLHSAPGRNKARKAGG